MVEGRTIIPLTFESWDAYFIVFKDKTTAKTYIQPAKTAATLTTISTPWKITFPIQGRDVTSDVSTLESWTNNTNVDIKYFSGTAVYNNTFKINTPIGGKGAYEIDLGDVKNIAEVIINGKNVGTAWKKPFKLDISEAIKAGENSIEVKVTNLWVNRLIGDAQPNAKKTTFVTMPFYRGKEPLLPSGLLGEVKLIQVK